MIDDLSNDYSCDFVTMVSYRICIHLGVSNITECFQTPEGNGENIYINNTNTNTSLDVNGTVNKIENGTVVSVFCPTEKSICDDTNDNLVKGIMLFNIGICRFLCSNIIATLC